MLYLIPPPVHRAGLRIAHALRTRWWRLARPRVTGCRVLAFDARGRVLAASRPTPQGLLAWQISVRDDGQRLFGGCLPTLIAWDSAHPTHTMPASGVTLQSLALRHPQAIPLATACASTGLHGIPITLGPAQIQAQLATPRGLVSLQSSLPALPNAQHTNHE